MEFIKIYLYVLHLNREQNILNKANKTETVRSLLEQWLLTIIFVLSLQFFVSSSRAFCFVFGKITLRRYDLNNEALTVDNC